MAVEYFFHFGRQPHISFVELHSALSSLGFHYTISSVTPQGAFVLFPAAMDVLALQDRLGGTIRIVEIIGSVAQEQCSPASLFSVFAPFLSRREDGAQSVQGVQGNQEDRGDQGNQGEQKEGRRKLVLGMSVFFFGTSREAKRSFSFSWLKRTAFDFKKSLRAKGRSARIVFPLERTMALSSASVLKNGLLAKGGEFCLFVDAANVRLGLTRTVQNVDRYSVRDYGRPARDMKVGMIPLKLAQMMVNIARVPSGGLILDPFCGFGTILQEGLMMGYRMFGSDKETSMVDATAENLRWLVAQDAYRTLPPCKVQHVPAERVSSVYLPMMFDAIVTEGTLGPLLKRPPTHLEAQGLWGELERLYVRVFTDMKKVLKPSGVVVVTFPAYRCLVGTSGKTALMGAPFIDRICSLGYSLEKLVDGNIDGNMGLDSPGFDRGTLLYSRPDQLVAREVVRFLRTRERP